MDVYPDLIPEESIIGSHMSFLVNVGQFFVLIPGEGGLFQSFKVHIVVAASVIFFYVVTS